MSDTAGIAVRGISKVFGSGADQVRALDHISLDIRQNESFTLLGPSGCGKTTLLRLIAGFELPSAQGLGAARQGLDTAEELDNAANLCPTQAA